MCEILVTSADRPLKLADCPIHSVKSSLQLIRATRRRGTQIRHPQGKRGMRDELVCGNTWEVASGTHESHIALQFPFRIQNWFDARDVNFGRGGLCFEETARRRRGPLWLGPRRQATSESTNSTLPPFSAAVRC